MSAKKNLFYELSLAAVVFGVVVVSSVFTGSAFGQDFARPDGSVPLPMDWSNQHLIYTVGFTREQASKMQSDPRYFVAMRLHGKELADESAAIGNPTLPRRNAALSIFPTRRPTPKTKPALNKDWAVSLGAGGVAQGMSPAKFVFDVNAAPNCTADFAVFPVNASTGSSRAYVVGTFSSSASSTGSVPITITPSGGSPATLTFTANTGGTNSGLSFAVYTSTNQQDADATNLAAAINRNLSSTALDEVVAVASSGTVTVYALTAGTGVTLTKPVDTGVANLTWGTPSTPTNGSQANIVGLDNLYSGTGTPLCGTATSYPTFIFSYASGVGPVATSPVISGSGTKIAYVENDTSSPSIGAILHVLTFKTGSNEYGSCTNSGTATPTCATAPVIPGSTANSTAADFMLPLGLVASLGTSGTTTMTTGIDSYSSPFVDYWHDIVYVGDNGGYLYSITGVFGVFGGTPAHAGGNFPVTVHSTYALSSPVLDGAGTTGDIFVGDSDGYLYNYASNGTLAATALLVGTGATTTAGGVRDAPIVDSTNSRVYAVVGCSSASGGDSELTQFSFDGSHLTELARVPFTSTGCSDSIPMYSPTPDNNYYTEGINSGLIYAGFAYDGTHANVNAYGFTTKTMNTSAYGAAYFSTSSAASFSPLTEFYGNPLGVAITNVAQSSTTVTITATNSFAANDVVGITGVVASGTSCPTAAVSNINSGTHTIVTASTSSFTFAAPTNTITSGSCTLSSPTATLVGYAATVVSQSGTTVTVTTPSNAFVAGQVVTIANVSGGTSGCPTGGAIAINAEQVVQTQASTSITFISPLSATGSCTYTTSGPPAATVTGPTKDYLFFGTNQPEAYTITLPISTGTTGITTTATNTTSVAGGTSGIIVDNDSSSGQAASLYFGTLAGEGETPAVTGLSSVTDTVTVTTPANTFYTGESVSIAGVANNGTNCTPTEVGHINGGPFTITVTNDTTFTYTTTGLSNNVSGCTLTSATATASQAAAVKLTQSGLL
jgi:hypothetical protein